ncbi:MAG: DNA integrity scanning protein DisA nucleotide-binding domain protein [Candidatus Woesearchaeota archaeon]
MDKFKVYETVMRIAKRIARAKEGALFVIAPKASFKGKYDPLFPQVLAKKSLKERGMEKVLEKLAALDGAVLISEKGELIAYGAKLKHSRTVQGFGTRHAAASGTTSRIEQSTAILVSEEINWIKVFKSGDIILETDSEDNPKSLEHKIISFMSEGDTALLTAGGLSAALLGAPALAPIMVVGGTYLAIKTATGIIRKNWNYFKGKKK